MESQLYLGGEERDRLKRLLSGSGMTNRAKLRIRIILSADNSQADAARDDEIAAILGLRVPFVASVRRKYMASGLDALLPKRRDMRRSLTEAQHAHLIALADGTPPSGHYRWTNQLLANKLVELGYVKAITAETVRRLVSEKQTGDVLEREDGQG